MKSLLCMIVLLSACATAPPPQHKPAGTREPGTAGSVAITGDELRRTGRTELGDAMRASSPIFR